jgi:hypothetical protein
MRRSWLWMLCAVGGLFAGCTDYGSYQVWWQIAGDGANVGCGLHGVDSIRLIGSSTEGDRDDYAAVCAEGTVIHSVPVGTWTFALHQVDVRGLFVDMLDGGGQPVAPTAAAVIAEGPPVSLAPDIVDLTPRPTCQDRIDNDRDGRVDLDDLDDCAGHPNGTAE